MSRPPRKVRSGAIANQLTRALVAGKKIDVVEDERGKIGIWVSGNYLGWLEKDIADDILNRD